MAAANNPTNWPAWMPSPARAWWRVSGAGDREDRLLTLEVEPLPIELRRAFGTSHGSTDARLNALVRLTIAPWNHPEAARAMGMGCGRDTARAQQGGVQRREEQQEEPEGGGTRRRRDAAACTVAGISEVGLPPKKAGVYEADYCDVRCLVYILGPTLAARLGPRCRAWGDDINDGGYHAASCDGDTLLATIVKQRSETVTVTGTTAGVWMRAEAAWPAVPEEAALMAMRVDVLEGVPEWGLPDVRHAAAVAAAAAAAADKPGGEGPGYTTGEQAVAAAAGLRRADDEATLLAVLEAVDVTRHLALSLAAARAGVEVAVLDAWAKLVDKPLRRFVGFGGSDNATLTQQPPPVPATTGAAEGEAAKVAAGVAAGAGATAVRASYYTVGLGGDAAVVESARWGRKFTPYLKLKVDGDLRRAAGVFAALRDAGLLELRGEGGGSGGGGSGGDSNSAGGLPRPTHTRRHVCVDANASWTPQLAHEALGPEALGPFLACIAVLEQPFPVDLPWSTGRRRGEGNHPPPIDHQCFGGKGTRRAAAGATEAGDAEDGKEGRDAGSAGDAGGGKDAGDGYVRSAAREGTSAWATAAAAWHAAGVLVVADESVRGAADVAAVARHAVAHGVNLKVEKAGGIRGRRPDTPTRRAASPQPLTFSQTLNSNSCTINPTTIICLISIYIL